MNHRTTAMLCVLFTQLLLGPSYLAYPTVYPDGVTIHEPGVSEGYVVFVASDDGVTGVRTIRLIDSNGSVLNSWGNINGLGYRPAEPGRILALRGGVMHELDWDGNTIWQFPQPTGVTFHHDVQRMSNENTLILCVENEINLSISDKEVVDDFLLEVDPDGNVVWEWHTNDHYDEFGFTQERRDEIFARGGDW